MQFVIFTFSAGPSAFVDILAPPYSQEKVSLNFSFKNCIQFCHVCKSQTVFVLQLSNDIGQLV